MRLAVFAILTAILIPVGCSTPARKEARYLETGKRFLVKKDYQRAVLQFRNAAQVAPRDPEPYYQLALAFLGLGAGQQAVNALYHANSLDPKHLPTQLKLAELMAGSNSKELLEDARKRVEGVLSTMPDNVDALTTLALTRLRLGKPEGVEEDLEKAVQKAPEYLRSSMLLASLKLSQRDAAGAERVLQAAVNKNPASIDPLMALGQLYRVLRRYPEAEAQFQKAIQKDSKNGPALIELAAIQMASGKKDLADQTYRRVTALPGAAYKTIHAQFLLSQGQSDAAVAELKSLMLQDIKNRPVRSLLIGIYLATNRLPDATKILSDVLAKNHKDVDALFERARIRVMAGQYADAQKDLLPVLGLQPEFAPAHHLLAKIYQAQGAQGSYRQELEEAVRRDPKYLNARLELAAALIADNAAKAALELVDQAPAEQKNSIPAMVQRNAALMALGQWDEAEKGIETGLKVVRAPELLVQEAALKMQRKDPAGARKSAEEALSRDPESVPALDVLMGAYGAQRQAAAGVRRVQEYAAQHPASARIQQYLGVLLLANGQRAEARAALDAAKAAAPNSAAVDLRIAQLDLLENKTEEARKTLSTLLDRDSANGAAHMMLAGLEIQQGNSATAIGHYRKVLEREGRNPIALNNLAFLLADQANQSDEALKYAQQAKELAPYDPAVDDTIGWVYFHRGLYQEAAKYLEGAVAKQPSARRKFHLGMTYLKMGDRRRGTEMLDQALKIDPNLPEAPTARGLLELPAKGR